MDMEYVKTAIGVIKQVRDKKSINQNIQQSEARVRYGTISYDSLANTFRHQNQLDDLRDKIRNQHDLEMRTREPLRTIISTMRNLYNELIEVYLPVMPPPQKIRRSDVEPTIERIKRFAETRTNRPEIERANTQLEQCNREIKAPIIDFLHSEIDNFLALLSKGGRQFKIDDVCKELQDQHRLSPETSRRVSDWIDDIKHLFDEVMSTAYLVEAVIQ